MTLEFLEVISRRVTDHLVDCPFCGLAGGEQADPSDLCLTGQELLRTRDDAEKGCVLASMQGSTAVDL
ncbi:MAG TPA: hypothetical protein VFM04_03830 [Candidatus Methylomirabilis sp.]|nr:hypothetical protein [Candidatus Methylomirabilis sp.]